MMDKLLNYIGECFRGVPAGVSIGMLAMLCVGTVLLCAFLGVKRGLRKSAGLLLVEYMFLLVCLSVLCRPLHPEREYSFALLWSYRTLWQGDADMYLPKQLIMNFFAFVPIGLLLGCVFGRIKWWKVLVAGAAFSVFIETLQFFLRRGFTDLDDLLHNVLGCLFGYAVYLGIAWLAKRVSRCPGR